MLPATLSLEHVTDGGPPGFSDVEKVDGFFALHSISESDRGISDLPRLASDLSRQPLLLSDHQLRGVAFEGACSPVDDTAVAGHYPGFRRRQSVGTLP